MAYLLDNQDEQNQQQSQGKNGSQQYANQSGTVDGSASKGQVSGGSNNQPAPTHSGSDFVNLQSFLGANSSQDRVNAINNTANGIFSNEQNSFDQEAQPLRNASYAPTSYLQSQVNSFVNKAASGDAGAMNNLKSAANQTYTGPGAMSYQMGAGNAQDLQNLQSPSTIANTLAKTSIQNGTYGMGDRNLDNAIYTGDPNVASAGQQIGKRLSDFQNNTGTEMTNLNNKVQGFSDAANSAKNKVVGQLQNYQNQLVSDANDQAAAKNANDQAAANRYLKDYYNWYTNDYPIIESGDQPPAGQTAWFTESFNPSSRKATASDFADNGKFSTLATLLGESSPALSQTTGYQGASISGNFNPNTNLQAASGNLPSIDNTFNPSQQITPGDLAKNLGVNAFGSYRPNGYLPQRSDYQYLTPQQQQWFDQHPNAQQYGYDPTDPNGS